MLSLPLCYTHDWITSCGTWNNCPWEAHMVGPCQAWHTISPFDSTRSENFWMTLMWYAIIALNNTQCGTTFMWHAIIAFGLHTQMYDVGRGMSSYPLDNIHDQTTVGVGYYHRPWTAHMIRKHWALQCYHRPWATYTIRQRQVLNSIIALWTLHIVE